LGTYKFKVTAPGYSVDYHRIRLYNVSDSTASLLGTAEYAKNSQTSSSIEGIISIPSQKQFRIDHYCHNAHAANGLGVADTSGDQEIYTRVVITKLL
jgi:hypothetical protein